MKRRHANKGNSFIMVIATVSFLSVLVAAILVAIALCYRMRAIDLNSRDNFYYLEQAMDEIYAGVGGDTVNYLKQAYEETVEILVYYDPDSKSYITMDNKTANDLMAKTFMQKLKKDADYNDNALLLKKLKKFMSNAYVDPAKTEGLPANEEGVKVSFDSFVYDTTNKSYTIKNLVLSRTAKYSTYNALKKDKTKIVGGEQFTQTLSTDLVVGDPDLQVNFNGISADMSALYDFACVADRGLVVDGGTSADGTARVTGLSNDVTIRGAVYAGSDFYNKASGIASSKYDNNSNCNGQYTRSMYSGIYVDGATLRLMSDKLVVPGTIAAMNCANIVVTSITQGSNDYAEVWADGIVLDGYALKKGINTDELRASSIDMRAKAFISDDLELNANSASFSLNGEYYGYNNATTDERIFTSATVASIKRGGADGTAVKGQAHYNSSAIILNGENTSLDLTNLDAMYIAGQSYIEVSKKVNKLKTDVTKEDGTVENVDQKTYEFLYDADRKETYTINNDYKTNTTNKTDISDYKTGEAISIKSNQLAYIPKGMITEDNTGCYVNLPNDLKVGKYGEFYSEFWDDLSKIPVVKSVISGKEYYFFDFSNVDRTDNTINQFIEDYSKLFDETEDTDTIVSSTETTTESVDTGSGLTDITDYKYFSVKMLNVTTDEDGQLTNIYSNAAITTKDDTTFKITAKSSSLNALLKAANYINDVKAGTSDTVATSGEASLIADSITTKLQNQYKEMKYMLTNQSVDSTAIDFSHNASVDELTPIKYYFDFDLIKEERTFVTKSGYKVWISDGDVEIKDAGKVQGIILAKGDVNFSKDVTEFNGLIVSAGKVNIGHSMDLFANEQIVKTILRECDETRKLSGSDNMSLVCDIFTKFVSKYAPTPEETVPTESFKSISTIGIDDIISLENWKKNVD